MLTARCLEKYVSRSSLVFFATGQLLACRMLNRGVSLTDRRGDLFLFPLLFCVPDFLLLTEAWLSVETLPPPDDFFFHLLSLPGWSPPLSLKADTVR